MTTARLLLRILACWALVFPWAVSAAIIETAACTVGSGTCATGIMDLDVGGTLYDVTFVVHGSYNAIYAGTPPTFLGDPTGATDAAVAIFNLLSASSVDGIVSHSLLDFFFIPSNLVGAGSPEVEILRGQLEMGVGWDGPGFFCCLWPTLDYSILLPAQSDGWTVFTAVPEPTTLALLGLGLAGLGFSRRKQ